MANDYVHCILEARAWRMNLRQLTVYVPWSISSACKNLRAQHPLKDEILCPEICPLGWVNMHLYNFLVCGPKFTRFLLSNVGGVVVVNYVLDF